jgi:two-component system, LytTR family, response regulator
MIPTLIIDDNKLNRSALMNLLTTYCKEDITIIGEANSVQSAELAIKKLNPSLLFLDIDLGDGSGFDLLNKFPNQNFSIIFVTAFDTFAIDAIKASAVDYLLKPININDLEKSVQKVKQQLNSSNYHKLYADLVQQKEKKNITKERIAISVNNQLKFIETTTILRCEADGKYTIIVLEDGTTFTSSKNLKEFEDELLLPCFFRVHHSHLINIKMMTSFHKNEDLILMTNGDQIPLAQRKKNEFMELITIL